MRKIVSLLLLFVFLIQTVGFADVSEEQFNNMLIKFETMQKRMDVLEEKVGVQQKQITDYENMKQAYEQRIDELEAKLGEQETKVANLKPQDRNPLGKWNPEIGVIADTVFTLDSAKVDEEGADRLSVRELELVFGSQVDPYSRLDATISFSDFEDPNLEEAYLTHFGLPLEMTGRIGKFKPKVGKAIPVHRDSLDTVDEPLVIQRYFGVEGLSKAGLDVTKTLDLPLPTTHQLTFGVLEGGNGEEGSAFGETRRRPTIYSHLKNYLDVTEETGLELGLSHMTGSRDEDSQFEVQILGSDLTLTHHLNSNQMIKFQGETFYMSRAESYEDVEEDDGMGGTIFVRNDLDGRVWGSYGLLDFRFNPQWAGGYRYDHVELIGLPSGTDDNADRAHTGYLTFYQSEFARWRLQYTHTDMATGKDNDAIYLQGTFAIGEHKHKLQ